MVSGLAVVGIDVRWPWSVRSSSDARTARHLGLDTLLAGLEVFFPYDFIYKEQYSYMQELKVRAVTPCYFPAGLAEGRLALGPSSSGGSLASWRRRHALCRICFATACPDT